MQAKTKTEPYEYFDPVFDGNYEVPIDTEYNLPDYCADVQRILKCRVVPEISSYIVAEDTITCDGICDIRIMYLDTKGEGIKCCDFTKEFSATIKSKPSEEKAVASIKTAVEHLTCRAVSARRIDVHVALNLEVFAVVQKNEMITTELDDNTIEKKTDTIKTSQAVNAVCHQFVLEEHVPLKSGKPPIETILRRDVSCRITDSSIMQDHLSVEGTADISFLYTSFVDGLTAEKMNANIDFSQQIDCSGADENCITDIKVICGESSIQPKEDNMGECTGVSVFVKVFIIAFIYRACEINIIDDAYSVARPVELNYSQNNFLQIQDKTSDTVKNKCPLVVNGEEIQKVLDIWNEQAEVTAYCDKGKVNYRIKYNICMLYMNSQNRIMYTEKPFDFNHTSAYEDEKVKKCDLTYTSDIWEYRITDKNTVEVSVETSINALLYSRFSVKQLTSAVTDENVEYTNSGSKLLVYYAYEGESLWNIAKEHKALMSDIRAQNDLYDDVISESGPIIICNR